MGFKGQFTKLILLFVVGALTLGCDKNFFEDLGDKNSEEALLVEAQKAMNNRDYDRALTFFNALPAATQVRRDIVAKFASAHAGKCGLELITLVSNLSDASSSSIFGLLFSAFPGATVADTASCQIAENLLRAIGDETVRDVPENLLVAFNAFAEIGTTLSSVADIDGDGTRDPGFDHCDTGMFSDLQVDSVGASVALIMNSFLGIGEDFADVQDIRDQCDTFPSFSRICTLEDGGFTALELKGLRAFVGSADMGLGSCGNMVSLSCLCP